MPPDIVLAWTRDQGLWSDERMAAALRLLPGHWAREMRRRRRPEDRQAWVLGRLLVCLALEILGVRADLAGWTTDRFGRPLLPGCPADFNLSHSRGLVAAAACLGGRVGVDVEVVAPLHPATMEAAFTPGEIAAIRAGRDQTRRALELWTAKEAALKADGRGLSLDPGRIDARGKTICLAGGNLWNVTRCHLLATGLCAVATDRDDAVVAVIPAGRAVDVLRPVGDVRSQREHCRRPGADDPLPDQPHRAWVLEGVAAFLAGTGGKDGTRQVQAASWSPQVL